MRMQTLLHAPEMHARTRKKCKYKYIKDKQRDKCIHIAGVLQTNTSSVHLFSAYIWKIKLKEGEKLQQGLTLLGFFSSSSFFSSESH